jgi:hypothetical protein
VSLNRVLMLGWVAQRPRPIADNHPGTWTLVVATRDGEKGGGRVERHLVVVPDRLAGEVSGLRVGQQAFVAGRVQRGADADGLSVVVAADVWGLEYELIGEAAREEHGGTHASPRPHQRRGHWRRATLGTGTEHLVWVRPTVVGAGIAIGPAAAAPAQR